MHPFVPLACARSYDTETLKACGFLHTAKPAAASGVRNFSTQGITTYLVHDESSREHCHCNAPAWLSSSHGSMQSVSRHAEYLRCGRRHCYTLTGRERERERDRETERQRDRETERERERDRERERQRERETERERERRRDGDRALALSVADRRPKSRSLEHSTPAHQEPVPLSPPDNGVIP